MQAIVCVSENWGIGLDGDLLFRIPADLKRFKELTVGKTVVYGSRTLKTFPGGKPLPGRRNIVLTHSEAPIEGVSAAALCEAIRQQGQKQAHYLPGVLEDPAQLLPLLQPGDLVLTLGAGSIGRLGDELLPLLARREARP